MIVRVVPSASALLVMNALFKVSALFVDVVQCLGTPLLEIKKSASARLRLIVDGYNATLCVVVYLFLINYGRSKADSIHMVIPNFLQVP